MADRPINNKSSRSIVYGRRGMIATSQPLAAVAGLNILMRGGNAIDAAIAANAVLGVVEPFMGGIGGDLFALYWDNKNKSLVGLNGSGRSGSMTNYNRIIAEGYQKMPERGVHTVTVPGAVDAWCTLLDDFGTLELKELLQPAIGYAKKGFPVSEIIATQWRSSEQALFDCDEAASSYLINGRAPRAGELFKNPKLAATMEILAEGGRDEFYEGEIAQRIYQSLESGGGSITLSDLKNHKSVYVDPISTNYRGYDVFELPPNTQGAMVLEMLNILEGYDVAALGHNSGEFIHLLVEAKKIAFKDRERYIADPDFNKLPLDELSSKEYARKARVKIDPEKALQWDEGGMKSSDTFYLSVVDEEGNCVSLINSIYDHFGSGIVPAGTGILLQNRGSLFSLDPDNYNCFEPNKRPLHTIIPAMVMKDGCPWLCFGLMGGDMQPQGHVQILINIIDHGLNIQEAGDAARVCHTDKGIALESGVEWTESVKLIQKGHELITELDVFGGYQCISIDSENSVLAGASDPRKDGCAIGY